MLATLTAYFLKYKKLYIPALGSFKLIELPATLDFANRLIYGPKYQVNFFENYDLDERQLAFISENRGVGIQDAEQELELFGQQIKESIQQSSFNWNGVGKLGYSNGKLLFHSGEKILLQPVTANKVVRENAYHAVLVGEQEMRSDNMHEVRHITANKKPFFFLVALIIFILAILFIAYHFYSKGFTPEAAGLD